SSISSPSTSSTPSVHSATLSSFSSTHDAAASSGLTPSWISNITDSISSVVHANWSNNLYAFGISSSKPSRTIVPIISSSPKTPFGSSKYFKSYLANFQCGDHPVTIIGSSLSIASPSAVAIAPLEEACTSQPSKSYSSTAFSEALNTPAPGSIPVISKSISSPYDVSLSLSPSPAL